jgi:hypothetical protein
VTLVGALASAPTRGVVANDGFDEQVRAQSQRVRVANPHLLCLHSSYLKADPSLAVDTYRIAPRDLLGPGGGGHGAAVSKVFTGLNPLEFMAPFVVPEAVLIDSFEALNAILLHDFDFALDLVALLHYASCCLPGARLSVDDGARLDGMRGAAQRQMEELP